MYDVSVSVTVSYLDTTARKVSALYLDTKSGEVSVSYLDTFKKYSATTNKKKRSLKFPRGQSHPLERCTLKSAIITN